MASDILSGLLEAMKHPCAIRNKKSCLIVFVVGEGGVKWHLKSEVQLDLKVPNLPTFHFQVKGEGGKQ